MKVEAYSALILFDIFEPEQDFGEDIIRRLGAYCRNDLSILELNMGQMLNIAKNTRKDFKRHFISNAFLEIRFPVLNVDWTAKESEFKHICNTTLDLSIVRKAYSTQLRLLQPSKEKPSHNVETINEEVGLVAQNKENTYSLQIQKDRVIFSTQRYAGFNLFWEDIDKALSALKGAFNISSITWIGVRKVNDIVVTNDLATGYVGAGVNRQIFTPIVDGVFSPGAISRAFNRYELRDENISCIIDAQVSKSNDKDYLLKLDIDFNEAVTSLAVENVKEKAFQLNEKLFSVFVWAVSDDVIKTLEAT